MLLDNDVLGGANPLKSKVPCTQLQLTDVLAKHRKSISIKRYICCTLNHNFFSILRLFINHHS